MPATRSEILATLAWLLDAGADEAVADTAIDRLAAAAPLPPRMPVQSAATPVLPRAPAPAARAAPPPAVPDAIGSAMEIAARCTTLAELKAALEAFEGCALKANASHTVFADGSPDEGIMCIGEAPGQEEDRTGLPFVGRAGRLLDRMLAAIGLDRTTVYITNVLPWRPPDNRNPDPNEAAVCIPFLRRHIELARPRMLILLGATAVRHVAGHTDGIMRARGRWLEYFVDGAMIPVMPTLHPAYLLRRPIDKKLAWRDLQAVAVRLEKRPARQ
jgi:DNA polymerase